MGFRREQCVTRSSAKWSYFEILTAALVSGAPSQVAETKAAIERGKQFLKSIEKAPEEIPKSDGMKVMRNVRDLESRHIERV
jgi:hypothetical protein